MEPTFFPTAAAWREWLEKHHQREPEFLVGFYKVGSGQPSLTWPESVDAALCFGWIDGVRHRIDEQRYSIRFTPRSSGSIWSTVNVNRVAELTAQGRMHPAGLEAFGARKAERSGIYAFEQADVRFPAELESRFRDHAAAWQFFQAQPAWYRRTATWQVVSAKKADTREKRFLALLKACAARRLVAELRRKPSNTG